MHEEINVTKSISTGKIYFNEYGPFLKVGSILTLVLIYLVTAFTIISFYITHFETFSDHIFATIVIGLLILWFYAYGIYELKNRDKLIRLVNVDKEVLFSILSDLNWEIKSKNDKYLIIKTNSFQSQISIIFDKKDILIHSLAFSRKTIYKDKKTLNVLIEAIKKRY